MLAYQSARLRQVVRHAWERVPHYRALLERHGISPGAVRTAADLPVIPLTTRSDVQSRPSVEMVARGVDPDRLLVTRTAGSSGEPIRVRRTWLEERLLVAFRARALHHLGMRVADRRANLVLPRKDARDWDLPQRILRAARLYPRLDVDSRRPADEIARDLRGFRPDVVTGYPGSLECLGEVEGLGQSLDLRCLISGGEVLTPLMRRRIAQAFGAPVLELYGSHEFKTIAWECRKTGYLHVSDDTVVLEVVDDTRVVGPGETGEVVATALHSFAMPFIRYRLGDIVTRGPAPCPCGAPFSTIRVVQGRMLDCFPLPGGRLLHPYELTEVMRTASWMRRQRVIQEREDRIRVYVAASTRPPAGEVRALEQSLAQRLGPAVDVAVVLVDDVPQEPAGKFRVFRSFVRSAYDDVDWEGRRAAPPGSVPGSAV
jgi:phenylacetate-CoA ligase